MRDLDTLIKAYDIRGTVPDQLDAGLSFQVGAAFAHESGAKQVMAEYDAVFGGEHSGHYYFRQFWRADTGMLAALHVLAALRQTDQPLSTLAAQFSRYADSGEINRTVTDIPAVLDRVQRHYAANGAAVDRLDGLTITLPDGAWFNLRPSNTEPLLRLNVEASDQHNMTELREEVLAFLGPVNSTRQES